MPARSGMSRREALKGAAATMAALGAASWPGSAQAGEADLDLGMVSLLPPLPADTPTGARELDGAGWRETLSNSGGIRPEFGAAGTPRDALSHSGTLRSDLARSGELRSEYAASGVWQDRAAVATFGRRTVNLFNVHTAERLQVEFFADGAYRPEALRRLNHFLRDWRDGVVAPIDLGVIEILALIQRAAATDTPIYVLSAYRTPQTNALLSRSNALVARNSMHMQGKAIDIVLPGYRLAGVRDFVLALGAGGVGFYPRHNFIHIDTGRVRTWSA